MKRDTHKYELKQGQKVEYVGITNDIDRRKTEHLKDKDFDTMKIIGRASTRKGAEEWETDRLKTYMKSHDGKLPKYNKNVTGK